MFLEEDLLIFWSLSSVQLFWKYEIGRKHNNAHSNKHRRKQANKFSVHILFSFQSLPVHIALCVCVCLRVCVRACDSSLTKGIRRACLKYILSGFP